MIFIKFVKRIIEQNQKLLENWWLSLLKKIKKIMPISSTVIVLESNIKNISDIEPLLKHYGTIYSTIERIIFNRFKNMENIGLLRNSMQKEYIAKFNIKARMFKSIWKKVIGRIESIKSNQKNYKIDKKEKIKKVLRELDKNNNNYHKFKKKSYLNQLKEELDNKNKINSVWGSKKFFKEQWSDKEYKDLPEGQEKEKKQKEYKAKWKEEWKNRRSNNIYIVGSSDESFGNSLCQLQNLNKLRLTLPEECGQKYLDLEVGFDKDKKIYQYLRSAIANKQALTTRIFQNIKNKKWYVQVAFTLSNECRDLNNGTIGVDINYNLISTCLIKKNGNKEEFKNYKFEVDSNNEDKNRQMLSDIVNLMVDDASAKKKTITIEKIDLKNTVKSGKMSMVCYNVFISLLRARCVKKGILLIEVEPKFTSIIGELKYQKRLGVGRHESASLVIGRRGLNYIDRIPKGYICLLQGEERNKSLLDRWNLINKRLLKVSFKEKSLYLFNIYKDQLMSSLKSYSISL